MNKEYDVALIYAIQQILAGGYIEKCQGHVASPLHATCPFQLNTSNSTAIIMNAAAKPVNRF
jgi:hypothetical protein